MSEKEKKTMKKNADKLVAAAKKDFEAKFKQMKKDEEANIKQLERLAKDAGNAFKNQ